MKNKKRYLRPCVEKVLLVIFIINFLLLGCMEDFEFSIRGFMAIGLLIGNLFLIGNILAKYGKFFADYKKTL